MDTTYLKTEKPRRIATFIEDRPVMSVITTTISPDFDIVIIEKSKKTIPYARDV